MGIREDFIAEQQSFTPSTPPTGVEKLFFDSAGRFKRLSSDGSISNVEIPLSTDAEKAAARAAIGLTNEAGEIVGPIIPRADTGAELDLLTLSANEIAVVSDDPGALRIGDGATLGGIGSGPPMIFTATAVASVVTDIDIAAASKYPGRQIHVIVTGDYLSINSNIRFIATGAATNADIEAILANRIVVIRINNTNASSALVGDINLKIGTSGFYACPVSGNTDNKFVLKSVESDYTSACLVLFVVDTGGLGIRGTVLGGFNYAINAT